MKSMEGSMARTRSGRRRIILSVEPELVAVGEATDDVHGHLPDDPGSSARDDENAGQRGGLDGVWRCACLLAEKRRHDVLSSFEIAILRKAPWWKSGALLAHRSGTTCAHDDGRHAWAAKTVSTDSSATDLNGGD